MTDQLISFETAKLAKEKGFDNIFRRTYNDEADLCKQPFIGRYSAPTQSLLQKWLREKHDIHMFVSITTSDMFLCGILNPLFKNGSEGQLIIEKICNTYEEALEVGLQKALKLL